MHSLEILNKLNADADERCLACQRPAIEVGPLTAYRTRVSRFWDDKRTKVDVLTRSDTAPLCRTCAAHAVGARPRAARPIVAYPSKAGACGTCTFITLVELDTATCKAPDYPPCFYPSTYRINPLRVEWVEHVR